MLNLDNIAKWAEDESVPPITAEQAAEVLRLTAVHPADTRQ